MLLRLSIVLAVLLASAWPPLTPPAPAQTHAFRRAPPARLSAPSPATDSVGLQATAVTTTTLRAIPSPSVLTETVSLEAAVNGVIGTATPTGIVSLYGDGALLGTGMISIDNWFRLELPALTTGTHIFTATYSGDSYFSPSNSQPLTHIVRRSGVRLSLYSANAFAVTFSFTVVPELGAPPPDGSVTVSDGTSSCTAAVDVGRCTIMFPSAGPRQLTATYTGSAILESNVSAPLDFTVQRYPVTLRAEVTPEWIDAGQPLTVTFVVMPTEVVFRSPSGVVTMQASEGGPICSVPVSTGRCTFIPAGRVRIGIEYSGDDWFAPTTVSLLAPVRVATGLAINATPNPVYASRILTLTAGFYLDSLACKAAFLCAPTGYVDYYDQGIHLGSAYVHPHMGFIFPITVTLTTPGMHSITGSYSGDMRYLPSTSAPLTVQVVPLSWYIPLVVAQERCNLCAMIHTMEERRTFLR